MCSELNICVSTTRSFQTISMLVMKVCIPFLFLVAVANAETDVAKKGMDNSICDDTKCRSRELIDIQVMSKVDQKEDRSDSIAYTCRVPLESSEDTDLLCAEGFEGRIVPDEMLTFRESNETMYRRYTCCPKWYDGIDAISICREDVCGTPDGFGGKQCWAYHESLGFDPMICNDDVYKYPRTTGGNGSTYFGMQFQYFCCNTVREDDEDDQSNDAGDYVQKCTLGDACTGIMDGMTYCFTSDYDAMGCSRDGKYTIPRRMVPYERKYPGIDENVKRIAYACCVESEPSVDDVVQESVCDETKCRAPSLWPPSLLSNGTHAITQTHLEYLKKGEAYSCWSSLNDTSSDMPCADNFEGKLIPDSLTKEHSGSIYQWYTCCPSETIKDSLSLQQECSDAACWLTDDFTIGGDCWADKFGYKPMTCADDFFKYPKKTGGHFEDEFRTKFDQYLCCSTAGDEEFNELDAVNGECDFRACTGDRVKCYTFDMLDFMSCNSTTYKFPRMVSNYHGTMFTSCCKTRGSNLDKWATWRMRSAVAVSSVSFLFCSVLVASILYDAGARNHTYNLYLVFLALPDAIFNLAQVICYSLSLSGISVNMYPVHPLYFTVIVNTWLNAVIYHQLIIFFEATKICVRVPPPSVKRVCTQTGIIVAAGCIVCLIFPHYVKDNDHLLILVPLIVVPPWLYLMYACAKIYFRGLLPKSGRNRALGIYMIRVVSVFVIVWIPSLLVFLIFNLRLYLFVQRDVLHPALIPHTTSNYIITILTSFQGTLSCLVAMGKPDINRAVKKTFGSNSSIVTRFTIKTTGWNR